MITTDMKPVARASSPYLTGTRRRHATLVLVLMAFMVLALGIVARGGVSQDGRGTAATPSIAPFGPGSPFAPGGSVYEEQVPSLASSTSVASAVSTDGQQGVVPYPPGRVGLSLWTELAIVACAALVAAATSSLILAVDRAHHDDPDRPYRRDTQAWVVADLSDVAGEVLEPLTSGARR